MPNPLNPNSRTTPLTPRGPSPTSVLFQDGKLAFGGMELTGLSLHKLQTGKLSLELPLNAGDYRLPGDYDTAKLQVQKDTVARVELLISQNEAGQPIVKIAEVQFSKGFIIKNPSSAFKPTDTRYAWLNWILDIIKDFLADFHLNSVSLDSDDFIRAHGVADIPGPFHLKKREEVRKVNRLLKLPMDPNNPPALSDTPLSDSPLRPGPRKPKMPPPTLDDVPALLKEIGAMTEVANFRIEGTTLPTQLGLLGYGLQIEGEESPIEVNFTGQASITPDGLINVKMLHSPDPLLATSFATAEGVGYMDFEFSEDQDLIGTGEVAFKTQVENIHARFHPSEALDIPMDLSGVDTLKTSGHTEVNLDNTELTLTEGEFTVELDNLVDDDAEIRAGQTHFDIDEGRIQLRADGHFEVGEEGSSISNTRLKLTVDGEDGIVTYQDYRTRIDGLLKAELSAHGVAADTLSRSASLGEGLFTYTVDPRGDTLRDDLPIPLLTGDMEFNIKPGGKLTIIPGKEPTSDLLAPFINVRGRLNRLVDPKSSPAGAVGSPALIKRIEELTGAPVHNNNRTELLIDGVQSYPKRLELIKNAKESIYLQTFIFKDDQSGTETAKQLIEAVARGVDVRVIVDTVGNTQSVDDFYEEQDIYTLLKAGGVKVALYNDPRQTGLADLLESLREIPSLREVAGPQSLKDPKIALRIFDETLKVITRPDELDANTREKIRDALLNFGATGHLFTQNEIHEISTGTLLNETHTLLLLKLVAEVNYRWHEKALIIDGAETVLGGMNVCDEYMFGGTDRAASNFGIEREAWRDTDMHLAGPAARDVYQRFADNWRHLTEEELPAPPLLPDLSGDPGAHSRVQIISHKPRLDGDHNITNVMVENLKALKPGEIAYIENSYFLPTGALLIYKEALIDAAGRGVDVRVLTNSEATTDLAEVNQAAVFAYRDLLRGGVRLFERTGLRTLHTKACVFGDTTSIIGSWNADNRSSSLNSEIVAVTYDANLAADLKTMILNDMKPDVAVELRLKDLEALPWETEIRNSAVATLSNLL